MKSTIVTIALALGPLMLAGCAAPAPVSCESQGPMRPINWPPDKATYFDPVTGDDVPMAKVPGDTDATKKATSTTTN